MRRHIGAVVVVVLALIATAPAAAAAKDPLSGLDQSMRDRVKSDDLDGAVLLVVRGSDVIHETDFGSYDADSVIPIASASKWLTSATLMTLVDEGKVSLDDSIAKYLPEFKGAKKAITVRQLLQPFPQFISVKWPELLGFLKETTASPSGATSPSSRSRP